MHSRTNQAIEVIRLHSQNKSAKSKIESGASSLSLFATSMSAYTAIKLTELLDVKNLMLVVPAIYHQQAYDVAFDSGFSDIIRKPNNWVNTDAWSLLEKFEGNLTIITAELDEVIPKVIPCFIFDLAINASTKTSLEISGSSRQIMDYMNKTSHAFTDITNEIIALLRLK